MTASSPGRPRLAGQRVVDPVREQRPVGELGQRVVEGPVAQLVLEPVALGHVLHGDEHRVLAFEHELMAGDVDVDDPAVLDPMLP